MNRRKSKRHTFSSERGSGDFGYLLYAFGAACAYSLLILTGGWIKGCKEARIAAKNAPQVEFDQAAYDSEVRKMGYQYPTNF